MVKKVKTSLLEVAYEEKGDASLIGSSKNQKQYFKNFYERRALSGIGHFVPREQPQSFVEAVIELAERK